MNDIYVQLQDAQAKHWERKLPFNQTSASAIKNYSSCARKWWFESICGIRGPQSKAAAVGEAIHSEIEQYIKLGHAPSGPANTAIPYLVGMAQNNLVKSEHKFTMSTGVDGVNINGRIDLLDMRDSDCLQIIDIKTITNKTPIPHPNAVMRAIQMIVYGMAGLQHAQRSPKSIQLQHLYIKQTGGPAIPVFAHCSPTELSGPFFWGPVQQKIQNMRKLHGLMKTWKEVPPSWDACTRYGVRNRCCFWDACIAQEPQHFSPQKKLEVLMPRATGFLPPDAPPSQTPFGQTALPLVLQEDSFTAEELQVESLLPQTLESADINGATAREFSVRGCTVKAVTPTAALATWRSAAAGKIAEVKAAFGRPASTTISAPAPPLVSVASTAALASAQELQLYLDCVPIKGVGEKLCRPLEEYIETLHAEIRETKAVEDLRLLPFGEGKALLVALAIRNPPTGAWIVSTRSDLSAIVLDVLKPRAALIIQGRGM